MKLIFIPFFILTGFLTKEKKTIIGKPEKITYIQPLGDVNPEYLTVVSESITSFYGYKCVLNSKQDLSDNLLSPSHLRYDGNKILKNFCSNRNILIVTEKDITTKKGSNLEWGVIGLGYRPGSVCIVSTFRLKRNATQAMVHERLKKVSIHEVGHNLGLDHCSYDKKCLMNDANGTITQIDREEIYFCKKCKNQIGMK